MPSPHLERKLKDALGSDAGEELATVIDRIDPIRGDIAELRHAMVGAIEKSAKEQLRFLFLASGVQLAAIAGLLALLR
jgi:hypothetical protein